MSASVVMVPGTLMPSAASSAIAPSSAVTAGNTATADCCVPSGLCTNAPYALPLTDCAGVSGARATLTPIRKDSAAKTCTG